MKFRVSIFKRAIAALKMLFVGDALAMPVHWFYNTGDIERAFPGGIQAMQDAPLLHPSSIMSFHSTSHGGRKSQRTSECPEIVGEVILKGKGHLWGRNSVHYHHLMKAGENTLNAHCARLMIRTMTEAGGQYQKYRFLHNYVEFMTSEEPQHPDTYAESYHRGFFANLMAGLPMDQCAAITHDTPSIGGLVSTGPIAIAQFLRGRSLSEVQAVCRKHLFLTHPDESLGDVCHHYVELIQALLFRPETAESPKIILKSTQDHLGLNLNDLVENARHDAEVIGRKYSSACYIKDSWPSVLYLAYKYAIRPKQALIANTNLGGDNVHRGAILGTLVGLSTGRVVSELFGQLSDRQDIGCEIHSLVKTVFQKDSNL